MIIPGFVDIQINGFLGIDFSHSELTEADCIKACNAILKTGTVAFLPTIITSDENTYRKNLAIIAKLMKMSEFKGRILGVHVEGPFLSPEPGAIGAHNPNFVQEPSIEFLQKLIDWSEDNIKLLTIAAERKGAAEVAKFAKEQGIVVSLGHQMALENDLSKLADAGAQTITHFSNGMPNLINRHRNTILAALAEERLKLMLITDGHHVPNSLIKIAFLTKGVDNIIVTSDACPLAGFPPGKYNCLGNDLVIEENGLLHNPAKGCMVGSSATMMQCINYLASLDLLTTEELVKVGLDNPLTLIGVDKDSLYSDCHVEYYEDKKEFKIKE